MGAVADSIHVGGQAGADLSSSQYLLVKRDSTVGRWILATAVTDSQVGVLQNAPASGEECDVVIFGRAFAKVGAAITIGGPLMWGTGAKLIDHTGNTAFRLAVADFAHNATTASGDKIDVLVWPAGRDNAS